jgi:LysM repeat protein
LEALKNRLEPESTPYTVAAGDTFEGIAKKQYGDPAKSPLVARVNNLDPAGKLVPGTVLTLPDLSPPAAKPVVNRPGGGAEPQEAPIQYDTEPDRGGEPPGGENLPRRPGGPNAGRTPEGT